MILRLDDQKIAGVRAESATDSCLSTFLVIGISLVFLEGGKGRKGVVYGFSIPRWEKGYIQPRRAQ